MPLSRQTDSSPDIGTSLVREPLVHFLALAALLFVANAFFSGDEREVITVDVATQEYLVEQRQSLMLRDLTDQEKKQAIDEFIEQEILVREARKHGLESSSRIRNLLIQNMRFFMASEIPNPTEDQLREYFDANIERFATEPSITYEHVFFTDPDAVADDTLVDLRSSVKYESVGDTTLQNAVLPRTQERQIVGTFGREQAPAILAIEDEEWHGPFTSQQGAHFLRVRERHDSVRPTFESAVSWLEQEWVMAKRDEILDRELTAMRENYRIEVLEQEDAAD